jgi:polyferredoxin
LSARIERLEAEAVNAAWKRKPLYEARKKIFPKRAEGTYRRFKWLIMLVTLGIYYLTPWLRWDRGPACPDQAVLVDMANRRFYFFFIEIWPQEFFFVAGMLVMAGIGLFLVTSTSDAPGAAIPVRRPSGSTCSSWSNASSRATAMRGSSWTRRRGALKRLGNARAKHIVWLLIAISTGGAWIFYFADAPTLLKDFITGQAHPVAYTTVAVLTATTYIFGGLMREQVCIYMCPWPRIQAAMLDEHSLVVTYNDWRGEPRSPRQEGRSRGCGGGRLRRLQCLRCGVPDGHRHSRRPAARMHHLRTVHRCL